MDRFARMGLALVVGAWIARYLGPGLYGELSFIYAYLAFYQSAAPLGVDGVVVRDLSVDSSSASEILGTTLILRVTAGAACWIAAVSGLAIWYGFGSQEALLCALAGGSLIFQAFDTFDLWFQSKSQSKRTIVPKFISYLCVTVIKVALIMNAAPLYAFAFIQAIDGIVSSIGLYVSYRLFPTEKPLQASFVRAKRLISESFPFMLTAIAVSVYMRIDQLMITYFLGYEAAGIYAAAIPLSTVWHVIPTTLYVSLAPYIARKKHESEAAYDAALLMIFRFFGGTAIVLSLATALAAPLLVDIIYGKQYKGVDQILAIHVFTNFPVFQGVAQHFWLINESAGRQALWRTLCGGVVSVAANLVLLPTIGLPGAAIAAVMSQAVSAVFSNIIFNRKLLSMQFGVGPETIIRWQPIKTYLERINLIR